MISKTLSNRWNGWPYRRKLALLALATVFASVLAAVSLISQFNADAILYKGF